MRANFWGPPNPKFWSKDKILFDLSSIYIWVTRTRRGKIVDIRHFYFLREDIVRSCFFTKFFNPWGSLASFGWGVKLKTFKQIFSLYLGVKNAPKVGFYLNFLQKEKFLPSLWLNYSKNNKSTHKKNYTTQMPCPCRFWNTPYLNWLLLVSTSGGMSKFTYIRYFLIFSSNWIKIPLFQMYVNLDRLPLGLTKSNQLR